MSVSTSTNKITYNLDGSTSVFSYTFKIWANSDMVVTVIHKVTLVETVLVLNTGYTISGAGSANGGNVTLTDSLYSSSYQLVLLRVLPYTQLLSFLNNIGTPGTTWAEGFDRMVMLCQQLKEEVDRCVKVGLTGDALTQEALSDALAEATDASEAAAASAVAAASSASSASGNASAASSSASAAAASAAAAAASVASISTHLKVATFTRDISLASGTQVVTGVGFTPKAVIFLSGVPGDNNSVGLDSNGTAGFVRNNITPAISCSISDSIALVDSVSGGVAGGHITAFSTDGFTITWTKTGSPTGTANIIALCIG